MNNKIRIFTASFQFRIFIALFTVTALFILASGLICYRQAREIVQEQMTRHAERILSQIKLHMDKNTDRDDKDFILPKEYIFLIYDDPSKEKSPLLRSAIEQLKSRNKRSGIITLDRKQYFARVDDVKHNSKKIILAFPTIDHFREIEMIRITTFSFIAAAILLSFILSYFLSKSIMRPLLKLRQGIDRIGLGELEHRVEIDAPNIAHDLAQSFNKMAISLQKSLNELKNTYAELQEKEKLAAVGKMTAGIAHEIKNPLGIILGSTQVVLDSQRPWEMREKAASFIMEEVVRLDTTLKAFLDFARPTPPVLTETDITTVFEETLSAIEERYREEGYRILHDFQKPLPLMEADPSQLRQILMNLLLNSFHSMPNGGEVAITIRSEKEPQMGDKNTAEKDIRFISTRNPFSVARNWLIISVVDEGCGMDEETLTKILDPFVSFRDDGIGLGLSIVSQLVKLHRGHIKVNSTPGIGTTFTLFFPCILEETDK